MCFPIRIYVKQPKIEREIVSKLVNGAGLEFKMLKTTKVQSSESNISIDKFYDLFISTMVHIDDDEEHGIMIVAKKIMQNSIS